MSLAGFIAALDNGDARAEPIVTARDPSFSALVEACALPRRFDAEIVGVLRGRPEDGAGNARLLRELCQHPFVKPRDAGGFVYDDRFRVPLLARFREQRPDTLRELTGRLVAHFEAAHARVGLLEADAARVGRIVQKANFPRYRRLEATLEARLLSPLLDAAYQLSLVSSREALDFIECQLRTYEDSGRSTVCRVLVSASRELSLGRASDDEDSGLPDFDL